MTTSVTAIPPASAGAAAEHFGARLGHVRGAVSIPHAQLTAERLHEYPRDTVFVVYCAGPHCNGADRGALRLAKLGRPVKVMIGGISGWLDEAFALVAAP